tara:strand:+ start:1449 stop:2705 length:1257 start_codon:yes stop_codon:yes gene_type:complete
VLKRLHAVSNGKAATLIQSGVSMKSQLHFDTINDEIQTALDKSEAIDLDIFKRLKTLQSTVHASQTWGGYDKNNRKASMQNGADEITKRFSGRTYTQPVFDILDSKGIFFMRAAQKGHAVEYVLEKKPDNLIEFSISNRGRGTKISKTGRRCESTVTYTLERDDITEEFLMKCTSDSGSRKNVEDYLEEHQFGLSETRMYSRLQDTGNCWYASTKEAVKYILRQQIFNEPISDEAIDAIRLNSDSVETIFPNIKGANASDELSSVLRRSNLIKAGQEYDGDFMISIDRDINLMDFLNLDPHSLTPEELESQRELKRKIHQECEFEKTYQYINAESAFKTACDAWFKLHDPKSEDDLKKLKNSIQFREHITLDTLDTIKIDLQNSHESKFNRYLESAVDDYNMLDKTSEPINHKERFQL